MRLFTSMLASVAMLFVASSASALVNFNVVSASAASGRALNALEVGDIVTIGIRLSNPGAPGVFIAGIGGAIQGYNRNVVNFVSGESGDGTLFCTNASCTNGLVSSLDSTTPLVEDLSNAVVGPYVQFVNAIATTARNGTGNNVAGIDGSPADAQFRFVFQVVGGAGLSTTFDIGTTTDPVLGNVIVSSTAASAGIITTGQGNNGSVTISVVPEPGTALLMGLGLAGLAAAGRRE